MRKAWEVKRLHPTRHESACSQGGRVFCDWKEFSYKFLAPLNIFQAHCFSSCRIGWTLETFYTYFLYNSWTCLTGGGKQLNGSSGSVYGWTDYRSCSSSSTRATPLLYTSTRSPRPSHMDFKSNVYRSHMSRDETIPYQFPYLL
jgi:hypothetical protein